MIQINEFSNAVIAYIIYIVYIYIPSGVQRYPKLVNRVQKRTFRGPKVPHTTE